MPSLAIQAFIVISLRRPGVEPGPPAWKAGILAVGLTTQCSIASVPSGWCPHVEFPARYQTNYHTEDFFLCHFLVVECFVATRPTVIIRGIIEIGRASCRERVSISLLA